MKHLSALVVLALLAIGAATGIAVGAEGQRGSLDVARNASGCALPQAFHDKPPDSATFLVVRGDAESRSATPPLGCASWEEFLRWVQDLNAPCTTADAQNVAYPFPTPVVSPQIRDAAIAETLTQGSGAIRTVDIGTPDVGGTPPLGFNTWEEFAQWGVTQLGSAKQGCR